MKRTIPALLAVMLLLSACASLKAMPENTPVPEQTPQLQTAETPDPVPTSAGEEASVQTAPGTTDWLALYAPVFDSYKDLYSVVEAYKQGSESPVDFSASAFDLESNVSLFLESQAKPGFCLEDFDRDGVPELIIGLMTDDFFYSRILASLFTIEVGAPKLVFTSYTRSRYCLSSEGGFIYEGSGGAAYSDYYACSFSGSSLHTDRGVYSDGENGFFYCEGGDRESAALTESISEQQFQEYFNRLDSLIIAPPELTFMEPDL